MPKRSTNSNLILYTSFIARTLQNRQQVDSIYTDFSAAFDKINHRIAVAKFERLGFSGPFLNWLQSYLSDREMAIKIGDTISHFFPVTSGVPQGSHLGPLIFLVYLNDVKLKSLKLSFADDFKLYWIVNSNHDASFLQSQLDVFVKWCDTNRVDLNTSKFSVISFSRKRSAFLFDYRIGSTILKRDIVVKDLGVLLDSKFTFKDQVAYVTSKASKMLGFIFRVAKSFKNVQCLKSLYCSLVRSVIEYSAVVWAPYYQNSMCRLKAIQCKFVRFALRHLPWRDSQNLPNYEDRCRLIDLELLHVRRDVSKSLFISDLLQSRIDCPPLLSQLPLSIPYRRLRNNSFLFLRGARPNYGHNEPFLAMCRTFNRCFSEFDFHLSRGTLRKKYYQVLASPSP